MVRRKFRESKYLDDFDVTSADHFSLTGELLDDSLCDFNFTAVDNYAKYKNDLVQSGFYGSKKLELIFMTNDERIKFHSVEAKTIAEIKVEIQRITQEMPNKDTALAYDNYLKSKNLKKHNYVELFYEVKRELEEQIAAVEQEEDEIEGDQ